MSESIPHPASTVILLRENVNQAPFDVFMVKRHDRSTFMAGAYVFPGGRVDDSDVFPGLESICAGVEQARANLPDLPPEQALGYHIAAIREVFEEAGVLLAYDATGNFLALEDPEVKLKFDAYRTAIHQGMLPLPLVAQTEGLRLALDALQPYAHWVTPEIESRRFDTRFFVTRAPPGQAPLHDDAETVHSEWLEPRHAIAAFERREIVLAPPTFRTLQELHSHSSIDEALTFRTKRPIVRIQPRFVLEEDRVIILFPGDSEYPVGEGEEVRGDTRMELEQGRWWIRR